MRSNDDAEAHALADVHEFQSAAEALMPDDFRNYVNNKGMEATLKGDLLAWRRLLLRTRALVDVSRRDTSTTVLGQRIALPVITAPFVGSMLVHPDGEVAVARGTDTAGTIMALSMMASRSPEMVGAEAPGRYWQQLYWPKDRTILKDIVERSVAAGASALCLTVDLPVAPHFPAGMRQAAQSVAKLLSAGERSMFLTRDYGDRLDFAAFSDPGVTWDDLAWLAGLSSLPILLKGIVRPEDAILARDHGASGVIVSNHGGQGLVDCLPAAEALPAVVEAVRGEIDVLVDGGIRHGSDILRALALGAQAVLVARPALWGLTVGGAEGVHQVLAALQNELEKVMALTGAACIADIDSSVLALRL